MKFELSQFEIAKELLFKIDSECDCRVWNEKNQHEEIYRRLKGAVRAWSSAVVFGYMDEQGNVLVSDSDILLAREYAENGSSKFWGGDLHKKYLDNANLDYRRSINAGSKILEVEGINDLDKAFEIYNTSKGVCLPPVKNDGKLNYSEQVLAGIYTE